MKWNDKRLRFAEMGRSSTMLTIHPELLHKIWKPDVFFSNEKRAEFHSITTENKLLRIDHEGKFTLDIIYSTFFHLKEMSMYQCGYLQHLLAI